MRGEMAERDRPTAFYTRPSAPSCPAELTANVRARPDTSVVSGHQGGEWRHQRAIPSDQASVRLPGEGERSTPRPRVLKWWSGRSTRAGIASMSGNGPCPLSG